MHQGDAIDRLIFAAFPGPRFCFPNQGLHVLSNPGTGCAENHIFLTLLCVFIYPAVVAQIATHPSFNLPLGEKQFAVL
jgi:hypothetical protein